MKLENESYLKSNFEKEDVEKVKKVLKEFKKLEIKIHAIFDNKPQVQLVIDFDKKADNEISAKYGDFIFRKKQRKSKKVS